MNEWLMFWKILILDRKLKNIYKICMNGSHMTILFEQAYHGLLLKLKVKVTNIGRYSGYQRIINHKNVWELSFGFFFSAFERLFSSKIGQIYFVLNLNPKF